MMKNPSRASRPTTIVFFDHTAHWSGGEISLFNLVTHLDRSRYRPVVVLFDDGPLRERLDEAGIETRIRRLGREVTGASKDSLGVRSALQPRKIAEVWRFIRQLRRILKTERAAIAHCNSLKADILGGVAAKWAGVPCIWHVRDRIADDYLPAKVARAFRVLARVIPTQVITVSRAGLEALQLPPSSRAVAIHNGTALEKFDMGKTPAPFSRFDGGITVGIVGRLTPWKGQHIFLEAAAKVREQFPQARFQIVGAALFDEGDYEQQLHALTAQLGLEDAVEWLGFRSDVPELVMQMDVLAHASTTGEPFGQVIIEGMAAGKPVVATNGGGVPEIVLDGETGYLVPMGDAAALAEAILKLCNAPENAVAMGTAGRKRATLHFSIEATAQNVQKIYEAMLQ